MRGEPREVRGRGSVFTHRALAALTGLVALTQVPAAAAGEQASGPAVLVLIGLTIPFLVAAHLSARGAGRPAGFVSAATILGAVPLLSLLYDGGAGAILLLPIAFMLVVGQLRGRWVVVFSAVAALVAGLTASAELILEVGPSSEPQVIASDALATFAGSTALAALIFFLAWRLERERTAASQRFARLWAEAPLGAARFDADHCLVEANPAFARLFDYPDPESMRGIALAELAPDSRELTELISAAERGDRVTAELHARRRDGSTFWVRSTVRAELGPGGRPSWFDAGAEDITAERQARDQEERFSAVVDAAGLAIVTQTPTGTILGWNSIAERLYGWSPDTVGKTIYDVSPPEEWSEIRASTARVASGEVIGPFEVDRWYQERWIVLEITVLPVRDSTGAVVSIASVARDITALAADRREREALARQVEETRRQETVARLAGGVAGDFNNLLTTIRGYAAVLASELPRHSPEREAASEILSASGRAADLTHQLQAISRQSHLQAEVVNLDSLVAEHASVIRGVLGAGAAVEVSAGGAPALVAVDRGTLAEVLVRLAFASRERMPEGGTVRIETRVSAPDRVMSSSASANEVVLTFADDGTPVPADDLPRLFEPYYDDRPGTGHGLDLAAVAGMVRNMGGQIDAGAEGRETVVTIRLPLATAMPSSAVSATTPREGAPRGSVLLVDDDIVVRTITRRILVRAGFQVLEAADASQARSIADADPRGFDILVTDVIMPGMHGPDLALLLRERRPDLPVLFISGFSGDELPPDMVGERSQYLPKPYAAGDLVARTAAVMALARR